MNTTWPWTSRSSSRAWRALVLAAIASVVLAGSAACSSPGEAAAPQLSDPSKTGQELVQNYMTMLAEGDAEGLEQFFSDAFLRQGAEGLFSNKENYLAALPTVSGFTIQDVTAQQDGAGLVVHWSVSVEETIDGKVLQTTPAPRLSTFIWSDGAWRLLAHANFNPPAE